MTFDGKAATPPAPGLSEPPAPATVAGQRTRAQSRRPITHDELPHLLRLGRVVARLRHAAALSQTELAWGAGRSRRMVAHVELGTRRTRAGTLREIAAALVEVLPTLGDIEELAAQLVELAGPALAPETRYPERVERRWDRRMQRWHTATERELRARLLGCHVAEIRRDWRRIVREEARLGRY